MERNVQEDLKKLTVAFFENIEYSDFYEYGSIGLCGKRPFGNSDVEDDILTIIGCVRCSNNKYTTEQHKYASDLYKKKLVPYLKNLFIKFNKYEDENQ